MKEQFIHTASIVPGSQIFLERPRIDRLLEKAVRRPIVSVSAGAGYGKSLAVYAFARKLDARITWMQLSESDNDSGRFWEKFAATVAVLSRESADKLAAIGFPATERKFSRYKDVPRTEVIFAEKYIFVYDDIHLISDKTVLGFIKRNISAPFPNIN